MLVIHYRLVKTAWKNSNPFRIYRGCTPPLAKTKKQPAVRGLINIDRNRILQVSPHRVLEWQWWSSRLCAFSEQAWPLVGSRSGGQGRSKLTKADSSGVMVLWSLMGLVKYAGELPAARQCPWRPTSMKHFMLATSCMPYPVYKAVPSAQLVRVTV